MGLLIGEIIVGFLVGEVGDMSVIHNADFLVYIYIYIYIYITLNCWIMVAMEYGHVE